MSAFQFPDPSEQTTTENPITGNKYQWNETSGKWVLVGSTSDGDYPSREEMNAGDAANLVLIKQNSTTIGEINNDYTTTEEYNGLRTDIRGVQRTAEKAEGDAAHAEGTAEAAQSAAEAAQAQGPPHRAPDGPGRDTGCPRPERQRPRGRGLPPPLHGRGDVVR